MSQQNIELVRLNLEKFNRGDLDGLLRDADPEIEWHDQGGTVHRGAAATGEHLRSALRNLPGYRVYADEFVDAGAEVVVCGHGGASGASGDRPFFAVYAIQAGRIRSVRIFATRAQALQAAGVPGIGARLRRWFSALSKGTKLLVGAVVAAGTIATAIGAIRALWPPTPELRAEVNEINVEPRNEITLGKYMLLHGLPQGSAAPSGATASRLAANVLVQDPGDAPSGATDPPGPLGAVAAPTPLSEEEREELNGGLERALDDLGASQPDVGDACEEDMTALDCGLRSSTTYLLTPHSAVTEETVEARFKKLFDDLRKQEHPPGQLLGLNVYVSVSMTGFSGRAVDVRWSLYGPGREAGVAAAWARGQRVLTIKGEAEKDTAIGQFWVPLPRKNGPYSLGITLYDEKGDDKLDFEAEEGFG